MSATTSVPPLVDDDDMIGVLEAVLDLWAATWGDAVEGTVLTVLWCAPGDSDEYATAAEPRTLPLATSDAGEGLAPVLLVVTDDEAAGDDPRAWCEIERRPQTR